MTSYDDELLMLAAFRHFAMTYQKNVFQHIETLHRIMNKDVTHMMEVGVHLMEQKKQGVVPLQIPIRRVLKLVDSDAVNQVLAHLSSEDGGMWKMELAVKDKYDADGLNWTTVAKMLEDRAGALSKYRLKKPFVGLLAKRPKLPPQALN